MIDGLMISKDYETFLDIFLSNKFAVERILKGISKHF
jgi:hypothetical protein